MKKIVTLIIPFLFIACSGSGDLKSPGGNITARVFVDGGQLKYMVTSPEGIACDTSSMGLRIDGSDLYRDVSLRLVKVREVDTVYPVTGKHSEGRDRCREYLYEVRHNPSGYEYFLRARLYDDGFAYRFEMPGRGIRRVEREVAQWRPPLEGRVWFAERNSGWKLLTYAGEWISADPANLHTVSGQGPVQTMPLLYETAGRYVMITEAALYDYSGLRLEARPDGSLMGNFTEPDGFDVRDDIVSPWRVTIVAGTLGELVNTDIVTSLNPDPDPDLFADMSWIRPGLSLWSWWSEIGGRYMTPEGEEGVIDIAARLGIPYSTVDDGWEYVPDKWEFVSHLASYGSEKGVGLFVWRHWERINDPEDDYARMRHFLDSVAAAGIIGVKIDFMNGEGKRQIDFNTALLQHAARRKLLVNLHGCQKPTGEVRRFPNEITREGVRGIELNRLTAHYRRDMAAKGTPVEEKYVPGNDYQHIPASHNTVLPFTRGVLGPADYTPVAFSIPGNTTAAHQLAFAFLLDSPLLTIAEDPYLLVSDPGLEAAVELISQMPSTWDETVVLPCSRIGSLAAFGRRKYGVWYYAAVNTDPAGFSVPLPAGASRITVYRDADDNGGILCESVTIPPGGELIFSLGRNSGIVVVIE